VDDNADDLDAAAHGERIQERLARIVAEHEACPPEEKARRRHHHDAWRAVRAGWRAEYDSWREKAGAAGRHVGFGEWLGLTSVPDEPQPDAPGEGEAVVQTERQSHDDDSGRAEGSSATETGSELEAGLDESAAADGEAAEVEGAITAETATSGESDLDAEADARAEHGSEEGAELVKTETLGTQDEDVAPVGQVHQDHSVRFMLTVVRSTRRLGKQFRLDPATGSLAKTESGQLSEGSFWLKSSVSLSALASAIPALEDTDAIIFGKPRAPEGRIMSERKRAELGLGPGNVILRSKNNGDFTYPEGPGAVLFDFDELGGIEDEDTLHGILCTHVPSWAEADVLYAPSSSCNLMREDTGEIIKGYRTHAYAVIPDAKQAKEVIKAVNSLLSGASVSLDLSVGDPHGLIYAGAAIYTPPIRSGRPAPHLRPGKRPMLDAAAILAEAGHVALPSSKSRHATAGKAASTPTAKGTTRLDRAPLVSRNAPRTPAEERRFFAALCAVDTGFDPEAMGTRDKLDYPLYRDIAWSIRAHEDEWKDGLAQETALSWSRQFASHTDDSFDREIWSARRAEGPAIGKARLYDLANGMTPGWDAEGEANAEPEEGEAAPDGRPVIRIKAGGHSDMATEAEQHLIDSGAPFYVRGQNLVRPIIEKRADAKGRQTESPAMVEVSPTYMRDRLTGKIHWEAYTKSGGWKRANVPVEVGNFILNRVGHWKFSRIRGVISTPTLRPDGSLLCDVGYDEETKLYLLNPIPLCNMPDGPTKDDAHRALRLLEELLSEFAFVDEPSRAVVLSALITPAVRGCMDVAPMHVTRAPVAGSGKTYAFDISAAITLGCSCPVISAGRDEEETEKRLGATALAGDPIINIDNVNGELGGDALCQIIERPSVKLRILGRSETPTFINNSTVFASGNNIRLHGDMTRRAIMCSLNVMMERPETKKYRLSPVDMVLADRSKYVAACLTIVRAYIIAGKPEQNGARLNSFGAWSRTVRDALLWLGCADPVATVIIARSEDPKLQELRSFIHAMLHACKRNPGKSPYDQPQTRAMSAGTIAGMASPQGDQNQSPELREALAHLAHNGSINAQKLGVWLKSNEGRLIGIRDEDQTELGTFRIMSEMSRTQSKLWFVEKVRMQGVGEGDCN
jgi:putative DNA primase/helicase